MTEWWYWFQRHRSFGDETPSLPNPFSFISVCFVWWLVQQLHSCQTRWVGLSFLQRERMKTIKGRISSFLANDNCNVPSCYSQTVKLFLEVSGHSKENWSFKSDGYVVKIWNSWHQKKRLSIISSEWDLDLKLKPLWYKLSKCLIVTEVSSEKITWLS